MIYSTKNQTTFVGSMSLLLEGLRCKRGSYTPEYQLTKLIFSFRDHPTPYDAWYAGFEITAQEAVDPVTLAKAAGWHDYRFLEQVLEYENPDITLWYWLWFPDGEVTWDRLTRPAPSEHYFQKQYRMYYWKSEQQRYAKQRIEESNWCLFMFAITTLFSIFVFDLQWAVFFSCMCAGFIAYFGYRPPRFHSYAQMKEVLRREKPT